MAITPADIQAQTFSEAKRGYDPAEVDVFLETLSSEVDAMLAKIVDLKGRLTAAEQQLADTQAQLAQAQDAAAQAVPAAPVAAPVAAPAPDFSAQERQISAALIAAQQTAEGIVNDANENAERIRNEADAKAREVIRQALTEKQAELEEIDRLKASREEFKAEYLKLIQHFMDDAQNSFPADLMASTPVGSAASPAVTVPAAEPLPVAEPVIPVADPFAPIDNFAADDLD
ncbi:DivIVA domain-containing protein [Collinsella aerofaciens]|uniref:DivIVA domain-containing protein n=1 Tax=Collinsella aerofaciens TaxID=74426 RepID=UPI003219BD07